MTEFETASLAFQQATLAFHQTTLELREATLQLREATLYTGIAHVAVAFLIGTGQIAIVYYGIRTMQKMGLQRAAETRKRDKADKRRHRADIRRHTETMTALQELIRRTSGPQEA